MDIYLANKLDHQDSSSKLDEWFLTKISRCEFRKTDTSSISDRKESSGRTYTLLIPFTGKFRPYENWKNDTAGGYTIRPGDIFFLVDPGVITAANVLKKHNEMKGQSYMIDGTTIVEKKFDVNYQIKAVG